MGLENFRKYTPLIELTQETLLSGEFQCPFTESEISLLDSYRDGFGEDDFNAADAVVSKKTFKRHKGNISAKIRELYHGRGQDHIAKALSVSILGGWVDDSRIRDLDADLSQIEFAVLFQRCFGNRPKQIIDELHLSEHQFTEIFSGIKGKLQLEGDYQVIAWGASKAKSWLKANPGVLPPFFAP
jgi:DNA-binding CsgD family transcriptional regulator